MPDSIYHDTALELEPYYDRGSEGYADDAKSAARRVQAQAPPCVEASLLEAYKHCRDLLEVCFEDPSSELSHHLRDTLCSARTCHNRLHHLMLQSPWLSALTW